MLWMHSLCMSLFVFGVRSGAVGELNGGTRGSKYVECNALDIEKSGRRVCKRAKALATHLTLPQLHPGLLVDSARPLCPVNQLTAQVVPVSRAIALLRDGLGEHQHCDAFDLIFWINTFVVWTAVCALVLFVIEVLLFLLILSCPIFALRISLNSKAQTGGALIEV